MTTMNQIVNVTITRETKPVSRRGFGTILIVGPNATFAERIKFYTDLASIAADLTGGENALEYLAAAAVFGQNPRVLQVAIGKKEVGDADYTAALNAIVTENPNWYGVILANRTVADQEDVMDWVQANERICAMASAGTDQGGGVYDIIDEADGVDDSSIAYYAKTNSLDRTSVFYSADAATEFLDAGYLGRILPLTPGSYTGMFKTIAGVPVDTLTATQSKNVHDKFANTYEEIGEVNIVLNGYVSTGEFTDIIIFQDWLKARIAENVFGGMVNELKIPYTDGGITAVQSLLDQVLKIGQDNGGISPFAYDASTKPPTQIGGYISTVPALADVPTGDKTARILNNVEFIAWLAGAIHNVVINGVLTV